MKKSLFLIIAASLLALLLISPMAYMRPANAQPEQAESVGAAKAQSASGTVIMYVGNGKAFINGEETFIIKGEPEVVPYLRNGSAFVPLRFTADAFGVKTSWNPNTRTAEISLGSTKLFVTAGSKILTRTTESNGKPSTDTVIMNAAAEMNGGRLCVPARHIAEALGKEVFYDRGLIIISDDALSITPKKDAEYLDGLRASFTGLARVGSKERLVELLGLDKETDDANGFVQFDMAVSGGGSGTSSMVKQEAAAEAPQAAAAPAATAEAPMRDTKTTAGADYSQTNVQVEGVDEADVIKTDGEYIYYARGNKIEIVRAYADGKLELMSEINVDGSMSFSEIFIDKDKIIAIGSLQNTHKDIMPLARGGAYVSSYPGYNYAKAIVYDVSDKTKPKEERSVELKGNYVSSRKTGNSIYMVSSNYVYYHTLDDAAPSYRDTATGQTEVTIGYDRVYCLPIISGNNIMSIVGFNVNEPTVPAKIETFLGAGENIYMSANNLYIAAGNWQGMADQNSTDIYKFAISNGDIVYSAKGNVPGILLNQFAMDEHNGYFRAGTTVYDYRFNSGARMYNCLYVLDGSMNIVGKVEDIAPEERIYSVRFMGDRAYMVTFKQVDPLFAIDVSDPRNPKIMGALKIPGYSDYLHPYDENHLIGFGKDTTLDQYGNAFYLGMKLSMFDITDITNPKEMFVEYIGDRGTESPLLYDHKALLFSKDKGLLAFPVTLYKVNERDKGDKLAYGEFASQSAYVYDISLNEGFKLKGTITHLTGEDYLRSSYWGGDSDKYIERLLYIKDILYTASKSGLTSSSMENLNKIGGIDFK